MMDRRLSRAGLRRRGRALLVLLAALALLVASCGSTEDEATAALAAADSDPDLAAETGGGDDGETDEQASFPVTITHKYGETTVEARPERVISVGFSDQDDLLALGVTPIAIRDWYGDQPFATWPWAQDALGSAEPEVLASSELNFEQIAALDPDLIVGVSSGMTEEEYTTLAAIAPTLAQSGDYLDYGVPWQARTTVIGQAVGEAELATELVEQIEARFASVRDEHPEFDGASAAVAFYFNDQPGAYGSQDTRSRIMTDLGFVIPEIYDEMAGDAFFASFSGEEIDLLDVDVLAWLAGTDEDVAAIADATLRDGLDVVAEGRELFIGEELGGAFSFASPLSLNHLLDELVPELVAAVDGDPLSPVASAARLDRTAAAAPAGDGTGTASAEEQAAMDAWAIVFDSSVDFDDKVPHLETATALESSNDAYASGADSLGGVSLEPTAAVVDGDRATITYDVLFGGAAAYTDLDGTISLVDGTWVVGRDEYCGFLASARTPCQNG